MKKINILLFLFFIYINSFSSDFCIALKFAGNFSKNMIFSRDFSIENYHNCTKCPFKCSFLFSQESFDNFFWGTTNRLSLKYNLLFGEKEKNKKTASETINPGSTH